MNIKLIGAVVLGLFVLFLIFSPALKKKNPTAAERMEQKYQQAMESLDEGDYEEAEERFNEIISSDPGYKDVGVRRLEAKKKGLLTKAKVDLKHKQPTEAIDKLRQILIIDPKDEPAKEKLIEATKIAKTTPGTTTTVPPAGATTTTTAKPAGGETPGATKKGENATTTTSPTGSANGAAPAPNSTTTTQPLGGGVVPVAEAQAKPIPAGATPVTMLPQSLQKFRRSSGGWSQVNLEAEARFVPLAIEDRKKVDSVFVAVGKYSKGAAADNRLDEQRQRFPNESDAMTVNTHPAYFGIYFEDRPKQFPPAATISWLSGNWYFGVTVVPSDFITSTVKRDYALQVARELGY